ncbi:MAG: hypothetical protein ACI8Q2_000345, partial [Candidatus Omnitrophota bacterium]
TESVWSVALSADGTRIVSGSNDKTVQVHEIGTVVASAGVDRKSVIKSKVKPNTSPAKMKASIKTVPDDVTVDDASLGGVDLKPVSNNLEIQKNGRGVQFKLPNGQVIPQFDGLVPVIINITPLVTPPLFLTEMLRIKNTDLAGV